MKAKIYYLSLILNSFAIILMQLSCSKKSNNSFENQLIFQVGEAKYFGENLIKEYERFSDQYKNSEIPEDSIAKFIANIIDELYVVTDACNSGLNKDVYFIKSVKGYKIFEMGKAEGPLWNHSVEPLITANESEIQDFYKKRNRVFYTSLFWFEDSLTAAKIVAAIKEADLEAPFLKEQADEQSSRSEEAVIQYPFEGFAGHAEAINQLQANQFSDVMQLRNGYSILYINKIDTIKQQPFKKMKDRITEYLKNKRMFEIADSMQNRVISRAKHVINNEIFEKILVKYIDHSKLTGAEIESHFFALSDSSIVRYTGYNGEPTEATVQDLNDYYYYVPIRKVVKDSIGLSNLIIYYIIDDYFWQEGCELGLANTNAWNQKLNRKKNELLRYYYHERNLKPKIQITENMMQACYEENIEMFKSKISGVFTKIDFADKSKLEYYSQMLNNRDIGTLLSFIKKNDPEFIQHVIEGIRIDYNKLTNDIFHKLYSMAENEYEVIELPNNKFELYYKNTPDSLGIRSLEDVRGLVRAMCEGNETSKLQDQLISEVLKPKHELSALYSTKELIKLLKNK
jgi:hypothetical protein